MLNSILGIVDQTIVLNQIMLKKQIFYMAK
jgi:hypothetical protein